MPLKTLLLIFLSLHLFANTELQSNYYVDSKNIMLSDIVKNTKKGTLLFKIDANRYSKRVKAKKLLQILKKNGIDNYSAKHAYVQFTKKSPINVDKIKSAIQKEYEDKYTNITIKSISVKPRSYLKTLPEKYKIIISSKSHLSNSGIIYIATDEKKKIFFNYKVVAEVEIYKARKEIKRGSELSHINCKKNSIILDKFRARPLQTIKKGTLESKHKIKAGTILTQRDVQGLYLVKRGSNVNVALNSSTLSISFSAKALQDGRYGDSVGVQKSNGTKIKVFVTGKHRAEVK